MEELEDAQQQVDQVRVIMSENINKVLERDSKLSDLQDKSESLEQNAYRFQKNSTQLRRNMWWQDKKQLALLCLVIVIILIIIIVPIAVQAK